MARKDELVRTIIREFKVAQEEDWKPPAAGRVDKLVFPPTLPTGTGFELAATDELLDAVSAYAQLVMDNDNVLQKSHSRAEWYEIVRSSFGEALYVAEHGYDDARLETSLRTKVDSTLREQIASTRKDVDLVLGCWLFENQNPYPVKVGPVRFDSRSDWLEQALQSGKISKITYRRLQYDHSKKRIRPRSRKSMDAHRESWITGAIGSCPIVCTVRSHGLSAKLIPEKSVRAAHLALTSLSLMWDRPSRGLSWMHLRYDGPVYHREYALFSGSRAGSGSALSHMPSGYNQSDPTQGLRDFQPYLDVFGGVIADYLVPHEKRERPTISDALFLSLWWYQQACREESHQIATTKFAASMDALAGGMGASGILELIDARMGCKPNKSIMKDGRTTKQVVDKIYNASRSRLIHGNSPDFAQDWSGIRTTAETLGRHMLLEVCNWLAGHPKIDNLTALRR